MSGWTCTPSATSPAMRSIHGFTAATSMGGSGTSIGPGDHMAGSSDIVQNSPSKSSGASPRKAAKMARTASTYSRAGARAGRTRRRSGARCGPAPGCRARAGSARRWPRPAPTPTCAVTIGLRGNATATPVRMSMSAASAAAAQDRYAVRPASVTTSPENPASAARGPAAGIRRSGRPPVMTSSFTSDPRGRTTGTGADSGIGVAGVGIGPPVGTRTPTFYGPPPGRCTPVALRRGCASGSASRWGTCGTPSECPCW